MKRILFLLLAAVVSIHSMAQIDGVGYYRVRNVGTKYYMYVMDNTGKILVQATDAEMGALQLYGGLDKAVTNPASVIYFKQVQNGTNEYICNFEAQGVDVYGLIGYLVHVYPVAGGHYQVYATSSGLSKYLWDDKTNATIPTYLGYYHNLTSNRGTKAEVLSQWDVIPVSSSTDNYVAIKPTHTISNRYFAPYYADYPFKLGKGMKAYVVTKIDAKQKAAVYATLAEGQVIPASTPVLIECASTDVSQNKIDLQSPTVSYAKPSTNLLKGVYFCNDFRPNSKDAHTLYDAQTMRVFGVTSSGKMGFVNSTKDLHVNDYLTAGWDDDHEYDGKFYLNANQAYLPVPAGTPDELTLMTQAEYDSLKPAVQRGDVNADGKVNLLDVQILFTNVLSGTVSKLDPDAADYNADGKVNLLDVQKLFTAVLTR